MPKTRDLGVTQPGGKTLDLGKTQPNASPPVESDIPPEKPADAPEPGPQNPVDADAAQGVADKSQAADNAAQNVVDAAETAQNATADASTAATQEYVRYRVNKPNPARGVEGDLSKWNEARDAELHDQMIEAANANNSALFDLENARDAKNLTAKQALNDARAAAKAKRARGKGG